MMRIQRFSVHLILLAVLLLVVAGCAMPMAGGANYMSNVVTAEAPPVPVPGEVTVEDARARPAPLVGGNGGAFLTLLNGTDAPVRLTSATSDVAGNVELHETVNEGGVMKMIPQPEGFEIPPGGSVVLKPGGKHVMLLGLVKPLVEGESFPLTLNFDSGLVVDLTVPVVAMVGMPAAPPEGAGAAMTGTETMTGTQP